MTVQEFEDRRNELRCQHCQASALELERNVNNGGVRPICGACRSRSPLPGVQWLAQRDQKPRRPSGIPSGPAVWEANGNHCAFCGKPRWLCDRLRIGLTAQHVTPVALGGTWGPLIPFCSRCQEMSAAALRETRSVLGEITRLDGGGTADPLNPDAQHVGCAYTVIPLRRCATAHARLPAAGPASRAQLVQVTLGPLEKGAFHARAPQDTLAGRLA